MVLAAFITNCPTEKKIKTGCIERSGRLSTEVFPEYAALFELNEDLDNFVR